LWTNNNDVVPIDGQDVTIEASWEVELDIPTARLKNLYIYGNLYFSTEDPNIELTIYAENIWVAGKLWAGSAEERYEGKANIVMTGDRDTPSLVLGSQLDVSNKAIGVTGIMNLYGKEISINNARLISNAEKGAKSISVNQDVTGIWSQGDEILLLPTGRTAREYEVVSIASLSADGNGNTVINLSSELEYNHMGAADVTVDAALDGASLDMRGEVLHLTRNIQISAETDDNWGGRVFVTQIADETPDVDLIYRGAINFDAVSMTFMGQANTSQAGLTFEYLQSEESGRSTVKNIVIRESEGYNVLISNAARVDITDSIFYYSKSHGVRMTGIINDINFNDNWVIANQDRNI